METVFRRPRSYILAGLTILFIYVMNPVRAMAADSKTDPVLHEDPVRDANISSNHNEVKNVPIQQIPSEPNGICIILLPSVTELPVVTNMHEKQHKNYNYNGVTTTATVNTNLSYFSSSGRSFG